MILLIKVLFKNSIEINFIIIFIVITGHYHQDLNLMIHLIIIFFHFIFFINYNFHRLKLVNLIPFFLKNYKF
jgi:hypothetical protein